MADTILVVDDSPQLRTVLGAQLKKQGYTVEKAVDGKDGLEKALQIKPTLIIMDIMMPVMDGFTAAAKMREHDELKNTPIILLSALGGEDDIIKGIECGADDYLVKPFKAPELQAKVKMLIRKAGGFSNRPEEETREGPETQKQNDVQRFKETGQIVSKEFAGFTIVEKLGQGGSGTVYRAIEPINMSPIALKVVSPFVSNSPGFVNRFTRSSDISIKLVHPHIVRCYTIGDYQGVHYLTQELMEGPTLDKVLEKEGPMDELRALKLMRQLVEAFVYLEEQGLIHRDIKPENVFVIKNGDGEEVCKIADFGLSRTVTDLGQTMEGHVLGTPHFLSPEQARGDKNIDTRGDLYSLAASFYQLLTGHTPFEGESMQMLVVAHISHTPPALKERNPELSDTTNDLIMRFLKKQPDERCAKISDALDLIDAAISELEAAKA